MDEADGDDSDHGADMIVRDLDGIPLQSLV